MDKFQLFDIAEESKEESKYTAKVSIPQYVPRAECPSIYELYSSLKYDDLISEIQRSDVSPEQKDFLIKAASRHLVFNYAKIADYYAHQDAPMQKLMEKSALVLIDFEDAIANGYAKLDHRIIDLAMEQYSLKDKLEKE